jgi:hypothetical protein
MKPAERPAPVLVAAFHHDFDSFPDAAIGFDSCIAKIIETAQYIVVPEGREREAKPAFVDDFSCSKRAEHAAFEQIVFGLLARPGDSRRFPPCPFIFEQSFEHADGRVEGRAPALGCFAVPAAIFELLVQELLGQCVVRFFEIRADAQNSAIDARLGFAMKVRPVVQPLKHQPLVHAVDHCASLLAGGIETEIHQDGKTVKSNQQVSVMLGQIASPPARTSAPVAGRRLAGEQSGSPAFGCNPRPLGRNRVAGFPGEIPHDLPADGRVRIEEPFEVRGSRCVVLETHGLCYSKRYEVLNRALNRARGQVQL